MAETEYSGPGLQMSPDLFEVLQAGIDFNDLQKTRGYKRLMDFLRGRAATALQLIRDTPYADDKFRLSIQFQWQQCEDVITAIEGHIKNSMALGKSVAKDLNVNELAKEGFALTFGNLEDDE